MCASRYVWSSSPGVPAQGSFLGQGAGERSGRRLFLLLRKVETRASHAHSQCRERVLDAWCEANASNVVARAVTSSSPPPARSAPVHRRAVAWRQQAAVEATDSAAADTRAGIGNLRTHAAGSNQHRPAHSRQDDGSLEPCPEQVTAPRPLFGTRTFGGVDASAWGLTTSDLISAYGYVDTTSGGYLTTYMANGPNITEWDPGYA